MSHGYEMSYGYQMAGTPIILTDPESKTERTKPQIRTYAQFDSRMWQRHMGELTYPVIRDIRNDPTVNFCRQVVQAPAIHTPWIFKEKKGKAPSGAKDFIEEQMLKHRLPLLSSSFNNVVDYGWSPYEIVYKVEDGKIVIDSFKQLLHEATVILIYVDTGQFAGYENWDLYGNYTLIPKNQTQLVNWEMEGTYWYGRSIFESVYGPYSAWNDTEETAGRYDKKISGGNWVVYYPVGQTDYKNIPKQDNDFIARDILGTLVGSGGVAIPDEIQDFMEDSYDKEHKGKWRIELVESRGTTSASFVERQKYLDNLKVRSFGFPERSVVEGKFGTKAEAETHGDIALSTIDVKHRFCMYWYNVHAINTIMALNYGPETVGSVWGEVAPLNDAQFQTIKEIYRLIIQSPQTIDRELRHVDTKILRDELGIPTDPNPEPLSVPVIENNSGEENNGVSTDE